MQARAKVRRNFTTQQNDRIGMRDETSLCSKLVRVDYHYSVAIPIFFPRSVRCCVINQCLSCIGLAVVLAIQLTILLKVSGAVEMVRKLQTENGS